jgi:hypothetical protein
MGPVCIRREHHRDIKVKQAVVKPIRPLEPPSRPAVGIKGGIVGEMANENIVKFDILSKKASYYGLQMFKYVVFLTRCKMLFWCRKARAYSCSAESNGRWGNLGTP